MAGFKKNAALRALTIKVRVLVLRSNCGNALALVLNTFCLGEPSVVPRDIPGELN